MWWEARHAARLARDARALGLGDVPPGTCVEAMRALGRAGFGARAGVVRVEATRDVRGALLVVGSAREVGAEPASWSAVSASAAHPGACAAAPGAKRGGLAWLDAARTEAAAAGADEALLWDAAGRLVEGARASLCVARADGAWLTPPLARGGVAGLAREMLLERVPELREGDVSRADVVGARELVACNAVRGARPVLRADGRTIGAGAPGPLARALAEALARTD